MARDRTRFVCQACGTVHPKWQGRCEGCGEWNTLAEEAPAPRGPGPAAKAEEADFEEVERPRLANIQRAAQGAQAAVELDVDSAKDADDAGIEVRDLHEGFRPTGQVERYGNRVCVQRGSQGYGCHDRLQECSHFLVPLMSVGATVMAAAPVRP